MNFSDVKPDEHQNGFLNEFGESDYLPNGGFWILEHFLRVPGSVSWDLNNYYKLINIDAYAFSPILHC